MYRYLFSKNPVILFYFILAPLRALSSVAVAGALSVAIDFANGGEMAQVWKYVVVFSVYILLDLLIDASDQAVRLAITKRTMVKLKTDLYHSLSHMCYVRFFQHHSADYLSNLTTDAETLRNSYFYTILHMYADFLRCAVAIGILVWLSPVLGTFVLATSLLQTLVPILYSKRLEKSGKEYSDAQEQQMKILKENLAGFLTAKTFHIEECLERNYVMALENAEEKRRKSRFLKEWSSSLSYVFNQIAHLGVFLFGAVLVIQQKMTVGEIVAASELIVYISYPILWLNGDFAELRTAKVAADKLKMILNGAEDRGGRGELQIAGGTLRVKDLCFAYGDREILSNISYEFARSKKYLIVGGSGSGKSTLLSLLAGLRQDYTGSITLDGVEIQELSRRSLSCHLCVINQEPFLFDDSLYNNICLFENEPETRVKQVLQQVGLSEVVDSFPQGIHTPLGENASALSGGEKQRVVIARALIRNTPVLLLDESTSHLDPTTAAEIEQLVLGLEGVTVLIVSHNATETAKCLSDEVLEMANGRLNPIK